MKQNWSLSWERMRRGRAGAECWANTLQLFLCHCIPRFVQSIYVLLIYVFNVTIWRRILAFWSIMFLLLLFLLVLWLISPLVSFFCISVKILKIIKIKITIFSKLSKTYRKKCMFHWFFRSQINFKFRNWLRFLKQWWNFRIGKK